MRLSFDRGTLLLEGAPAGVEAADFPGFLWDERAGALRAPARLAYALAAALRRREVPLTDMPRPRLVPPSGIRPVTLRPYQHGALVAWRRSGRRGLVVLPEGAGKTRVALAAIAATRTPCLVLVPTRARLARWSRALAEIHDGPIGRFDDGESVLAPLTVATFVGAHRHMSAIGDRFGMLVVDQAHHFGTGAFDEALEMSIAPVRLGLTSTPPPPGPAAARLAELVGPPVFELGVAELAGRWRAPLRRVTWQLALDEEERREYDALVAVYREAVRGFMDHHLGASWADFLREAARTDEGRRGIAAWRRAARLLAFPRCKREALGILLRRHHEQRTLVFVAHDETAHAIAREHLIMPLTAEIGGEERQATLERFRSGELRALVSAQVLDEGVDVPEAEVGIVVAGRVGERELAQHVGRLLRAGPGKQALLYELVVAQSGEVGQARLAAARRTAA